MKSSTSSEFLYFITSMTIHMHSGIIFINLLCMVSLIIVRGPHLFISLRNPACVRQFSSYRSTFEVGRNKWETVRLPWSSFVGYGPGSDNIDFDPSELRRIAVVAIGKAMEVYLAVSSVRFYRSG